MNLLLVDDEMLALKALEKAVSTVLPNGTINAFSKATEAVEFARNNKIDIAFLDIDMRIMNGLEMAKALQEINDKTNIIFVTGFAEYALDAFNLFASAYLTKPVTADAIIKAVGQLRHPIETEKRVRFHCFGNFEIFCDNKPVAFNLNKSKEMLAYLVDREGAECRKNEIIASLFEDDISNEYYKRLRKDLLDTLTQLGVEDIIIVTHGGLALDKSKVDCDFYDYLEGDRITKPTEYMIQYSFAEETFARFLGS